MEDTKKIDYKRISIRKLKSLATKGKAPNYVSLEGIARGMEVITTNPEHPRFYGYLQQGRHLLLFDWCIFNHCVDGGIGPILKTSSETNIKIRLEGEYEKAGDYSRIDGALSVYAFEFNGNRYDTFNEDKTKK